MRFLHAYVHAHAFFQGSEEAQALAPCPTCQYPYLAVLDPHEATRDLQGDVWKALRRLNQECPDHAHRFEV